MLPLCGPFFLARPNLWLKMSDQEEKPVDVPEEEEKDEDAEEDASEEEEEEKMDIH